MDQALKARLIGAAILVALAVLVIPELLSGRRPAGPAAPAESPSSSTRTYTIELGTTTAQGENRGTPSAPVTSQQDARLPTPAPAPAAAQTAQTRSSGSTSEPAAPPVAIANTPGASKPAAVATPPPVAVNPSPSAAQAATDEVPATTAATAKPSGDVVRPTRGTWSVQVGAFSSADAARKLETDLEKAGFPAYVSPIAKGGKTLHRVRVGPETARAAADSLATRLKSRGLPATVVAND